MNLIIRQGRVVDPTQNLDSVADLCIVDGRVREIAARIPEQGQAEIDARGMIVAPGFVDMHVHLREPGRESAETIESGTRAAARGGFTGVACMPNTHPVNDCGATTAFIMEKAREVSKIHVYPIGAITKGSQGRTLADIGEMWRAGIVAISDDGQPVQDSQVMRRAMEYSCIYDLPVIDHCEDRDLAAKGAMNEGYFSTLLGIRGMNTAAEEVQVVRDAILGRVTRARVHIAHLSARGSLEAAVQAKKAGIRLTCEVTPHHLFLTDADAGGFDPNAKMNPPLRSQEHVQALIQGLGSGQIDVIATDHAPHTFHSKMLGFEKAPFGVVGLETAVSLVMDRLLRPGIIDACRMVELMSVNPCRILRLEGKGTLRPGAWGDVTIIDPELRVEVRSAEFLTRSRNTPFEGWKLLGGPVYTVVRGHTVWSL
jgi:dihydroorotase